MQKDGDRSKVFTRRLVLLAGGKALLVLLLGGRMYYLQVVEAEKYLTLAEENRINMRLIPPPRGRILDRFGGTAGRQPAELPRPCGGRTYARPGGDVARLRDHGAAG